MKFLKKFKNKSIKNGIDPKITTRIWNAMIWSFADFQRRNFKKKIIIYYVVVTFSQ